MSNQSDRAYRRHVYDKQMIWLAMTPSSPGGRSYRNPDHSLVDDMPSASTGVCFDKAVIIRPRAPPPGRHTIGCNGLRGEALCRLCGSPPPRGRTLDWGRKPPEGGEPNKKIAGRDRGTVHV